MEDHGLRIAVGGRHVGKPFHVAAEPIVRGLHDERIDLALSHLLARGRPTALEFFGRNRGGDAVSRAAHCACPVLFSNPKSFSALPKQMASRTRSSSATLSMKWPASSAFSNG